MYVKKAKLLSIALLINVLLSIPGLAVADQIQILFQPEWKPKAAEAKAIAEALSQSSGLEIQPRIAESYPQILETFVTGKPIVLYIGSFVQCILHARGLYHPFLQGIDGKEFYRGILIAPAAAGDDPVKIVKDAGSAIAYAVGASSGESAAKAASGGLAQIATNNHMASVNAVKAGKAQCAFVKNWWWEANKSKYPDMTALDYPGISDHKNPDNVLCANKAVSAEMLEKIKAAASSNVQAFGVKEFKEVGPDSLSESLDLMKKGKIDPLTYSW